MFSDRINRIIRIFLPFQKKGKKNHPSSRELNLAVRNNERATHTFENIKKFISTENGFNLRRRRI